MARGKFSERAFLRGPRSAGGKGRTQKTGFPSPGSATPQRGVGVDGAHSRTDGDAEIRSISHPHRLPELGQGRDPEFGAKISEELGYPYPQCCSLTDVRLGSWETIHGTFPSGSTPGTAPRNTGPAKLPQTPRDSRQDPPSQAAGTRTGAPEATRHPARSPHKLQVEAPSV